MHNELLSLIRQVEKGSLAGTIDAHTLKKAIERYGNEQWRDGYKDAANGA